MDYQEKISRLEGSDFFALFSQIHAHPRWVMSAGKKSIQIIGLCHKGENHSALFDPTTLVVHCFSECSRAYQIHNWISQALDFSNSTEGQDFLEDWIDGKIKDIDIRSPRSFDFIDNKEESYHPQTIVPIDGINKEIIASLYRKFDSRIETLERLVWARQDKIAPHILKEFDVAYYVDNDAIILPHHNIRGEIVGLYERSFRPLRKVIKESHPHMPYKELLKYPRAKYVPLLRSEEYRTEEKTSWSFSNTKNLYGLHLAAEHIRNSGQAIIFEGGKSVMLAHQYGYPQAVATHTYGAHLNHISMLIECGAKEIILAFDKQYRSEIGKSWDLFLKKTMGIKEKVKEFVDISIIVDRQDLIDYKDSPIDQGATKFEMLMNNRFKDGVKKKEDQKEKMPEDHSASNSEYRRLRNRERPAWQK